MKALKKTAIRLIAVLFCICTLLPFFFIPTAAENLPSLDGATAVILYSINGTKILASKNPDTTIYPAATVKIMSGLILCEKLESRLDEKVTLSAQMLSGVTGRSFGLKIGDTLTVHDLLRIAVCGSYNDAYCALAVIVGGSIEEFIELMNERAASLGATSTNYENVTGIDNEKMLTTARDVLNISLAAEKNKLYMNLSSLYSYTVTINSSTKNIENRNALHNIYSEFYNNNAIGFAAGMTDLGGYCVATKGEFGDAEYICIVMGAGENTEYALATSLLSFTSENYSTATLKTAGTIVGTLPVSLSDKYSEISLVLGEDITVLIDKSTQSNSEKTLDLVLSKSELKAPVKKGEHVGFMIVRSGNDVLACVPVVTAEGTEKNAILGTIDDMKNFISSRGVIASVAFFTVSMLLFFIFSAMAKKRRRKRPVYAKGRYR